MEALPIEGAKYPSIWEWVCGLIDKREENETKFKVDTAHSRVESNEECAIVDGKGSTGEVVDLSVSDPNFTLRTSQILLQPSSSQHSVAVPPLTREEVSCTGGVISAKTRTVSHPMAFSTTSATAAMIATAVVSPPITASADATATVSAAGRAFTQNPLVSQSLSLDSTLPIDPSTSPLPMEIAPSGSTPTLSELPKPSVQHVVMETYTSVQPVVMETITSVQNVVMEIPTSVQPVVMETPTSDQHVVMETSTSVQPVIKETYAPPDLLEPCHSVQSSAPAASNPVREILKKSLYGIAVCAVRCPAYFKAVHRMAATCFELGLTSVSWDLLLGPVPSVLLNQQEKLVPLFALKPNIFCVSACFAFLSPPSHCTHTSPVTTASHPHTSPAHIFNPHTSTTPPLTHL